ncbi:3-oxoadipate enol-lactonase [Bradyrhizobium sp. AUGA SZCCT0240]|uniref:3-oxoadipate enol-lactonase n=1 Tax=Bradyrhizobium sp. AUGA SZCCT0240 TaxID=2807669 RepID=UPI001BA843EE|nr:3-oxoadipate enol-lactonase [Bradyrhizobium sp. AUGA SZCCT0240]MBR1256346.1 3-oxoadipate enol-lactonase [Bradyrhizobium sp. AUGA SZCCT0240]
MTTPGSCVVRVAVDPGVALSVAVTGAKENACLVLSNSLGASWGMWDELVQRLRPSVRIVRYDTRGHGCSDAPPGPLTLEKLGRDVLAIMDNLQIERAVFCGLSLGGLTGMWLGANAPARFDGLVLANTAANFPPPDLWKGRADAVRASGMAPLVEPTLDRWFTETFRKTSPKRVDEIGQMLQSTSINGYAACCGVLAEADMSSQLARIPCRVRVIAGEHDPSTPPSRGAEIVSAIAGADMITLDAAHLSSVEAAEEFALGVRDFMEKI